MTAQRILLVDNDQHGRVPLAHSLEQAGYDVLTARDGLEALRLLASAQPDAALIDVVLPGFSGFDICRAIKDERAIPVLLMSGNAALLADAQQPAVGADGFLVRPFAISDLLAQLRRLLG